MIDGSEAAFEENAALTSKVVEMAHAAGVSVEGEIGTIGKLSTSDEGGVDHITYTNPEDVVRFIEATGADALAIAIGTAHGIYPRVCAAPAAGSASGNRQDYAGAAGSARRQR